MCGEGMCLIVNSGRWELKRVTKQANKRNLAGWIPHVWSRHPLQSSVPAWRAPNHWLSRDVQVFKGNVVREDKIWYNAWLEIIVNVMKGRIRFLRSLMRFPWYERNSLFDPNRSIMSHAVLAEEPSRPV